MPRPHTRIDRPFGRAERLAWALLLACVALVPVSIATWLDSTAIAVRHPFTYPQSLALAALTALAAVAWVASLPGDGLPRVTYNTPLLLGLLIVVFAAASAALAPEPMRAIFGTSESGLPLGRLACLFVISLLVQQTLGTRGRLALLTRTVVAGAAMIAAFALLQQFFGVSLPGLTAPLWMTGRGFSTLGNPDFLGTFLVFPAALALWEASSGEPGPWQKTSLVAATVIVTALVNTLTRGAWAGLAVGSMLIAIARIVAWRRDGSPRGLLVLAGMLVAGIMLSTANWGVAAIGSRLDPGAAPGRTNESAADALHTLTSGRTEMWRVAIATMIDRPLTGVGPASFEYAWFAHARTVTSDGGTLDVERDPHSLPLLLGATLGVPALLAALALVAVTLAGASRASRRHLRSGSGGPGASLAVGWTLATAASLVALVPAAVTTPILLQITVGLAVVARITSQPQILKLARPASVLLAVGVLAVTLAPLIVLAEQGSAQRAVASADGAPGVAVAETAMDAVAWDADLQRAYFMLRVQQVNRLFDRDDPAAPEELERLLGALEARAQRFPDELYYRAAAAQALADAATRTGDSGYSERAVRAADDALAIMQASLPVRVNRAIALGHLEHWTEMAATLGPWWRNERTSAYPGALYAQALAESGDVVGAYRTLAELEALFPSDDIVPAARSAVEAASSPGP